MRYPWILFGAAAALLLGAATPTPGSTVVAKPAGSYAASSRLPMLYPTSVAVDVTGRVWVADGARNRVLVFAADGRLSQTVRKVAGGRLSRPMGIASSDDGRIWIADAGNARIAILNARSTEESDLPLPKKYARADLTDVEVAPDASRLWAVDNDGNRVLVADLATSRWQAWGGRGTGWGKFNHPRTVAVDGEGRVYVTDVLNGRVQRLDQRGRSTRPIVGFGASPGLTFRPSGIDVEGGLLWLADSVMGVVQAFEADGSLVDAVRDGSGAVRHFDRPIGIDVVGDRLYVVEAGGSKVTAWALAAGGGKPLVATEHKRPSSSASEGQDCNYCHLDFVPPLEEGKATPLVAVPSKKHGLSWAGTEAACISCHDGAVLDSRRHIWSGYAHPREDAKIPKTMDIPQDMPLEGGKITCRTCHSPHTLGGSGQQHRGVVMLRAKTRPSELCVACHGPDGGSR